jgi:hypothetical protein
MMIFENKVLIIFGPRWDGPVRGWGKMHNGELHKLYSSSNTNRMIKSRRMRRAGHVACMGGEEVYI